MTDRRNLLLTGGPGPGHDFAATANALESLLREVGFATTTTTDAVHAFDRLADPREPWDLFTVHALRWRMEAERFASQRDEFALEWDPAWSAPLRDHVLTGGGMLALHTAVLCFDAAPPWRELIGASWNWERSSHPPLGPVTVRLTPEGTRHPASSSSPPSFHLDDEVYCDLDQQPGSTRLAMGSHDTGDDGLVVWHPVVWAREVGDGRVVTDLLGHDAGSYTQPDHARLVQSAAVWAAGDPRTERRA